MKKIRIGTDIRLQFSLYELSDYDNTAIKSLRCYVVPADMAEYIDLERFAYPQYYSPTEYSLSRTGRFDYNWLPYNQEVFNAGMFGPIDDYIFFPSYNGFGIRSKQFKIIPKEYLAPSKVLPQKNTIEMYYPAQDQTRLGRYRVVIVVTLYQPGWGSNNLRTMTIDKGIQFMLVDNPDINSNGDVHNSNDPVYDPQPSGDTTYTNVEVYDKAISSAPEGYAKIYRMRIPNPGDPFKKHIFRIQYVRKGETFYTEDNDSPKFSRTVLQSNIDVSSQVKKVVDGAKMIVIPNVQSDFVIKYTFTSEPSFPITGDEYKELIPAIND